MSSLTRMQKSLGKQIRKIRNNYNLSQDRFGKKLGVSGKTISSYENNKSLPSLTVLENISKIYKVPLIRQPRIKKYSINSRINKVHKALEDLEKLVEDSLSL